MYRLHLLVVIVVFLGILVSLGSALYHLSRGGTQRSAEDSKKMARALTVRVGLSVGGLGLCLGDEELEGLRTFYRYAAEAGLAEQMLAARHAMPIADTLISAT